MTWLGIKTDITPVADVAGAAEWAANIRLRKANEMHRRHGYLSTAIAKQAGPIRYIISGNTTHANWLTFDTDGEVEGFVTAGAGGGGGPWPPPPVGPKKRKPKGERQVCTLWGPFADGGTDTGTLNAIFNLPADSCPGTFFFSALEGEAGSGGSGAGGDYGYSIDVLADGVPIFVSGCLVNDSATAVIPAGTLVLDYTVTASCQGGLIPGTWAVSATSP